MVATSYAQRLILQDEIIERVPNTVIAQALSAEGVSCGAGGSYCHHLHPFWKVLDLYHDGRPTRQFFAARDVTQGPGGLPALDSQYVGQVAAAYRKVFENLDQLEGIHDEGGTVRTRTQG